MREDVGASDATADAYRVDAPPTACPAACDPTLRGRDTCLDSASCLLRGAEPTCGAPGTQTLGQVCETVDACAAGLACFRAARTSGGICAPVCCTADPSACTMGRCGGDGVLVDGTTTSYGRCVLPRTCDVLAPELTCEMREGCFIVDAEGHTECRTAGGRLLGESCTLPEDCGAGLFCGGLETRTCLRICAIDTARGCGADERCVAQTYSPVGSGICVAIATARP